MWEELGISGGTAIIILVVGYFVIKSAVKNGVKQAYEDIKSKQSAEDVDDFADDKEIEINKSDDIDNG